VRLLLDALCGCGESRPDRRFELTVIGDGAERADLAKRALPANVRVEWQGHVPYESLPASYAAAGLFVFPTLGDEWGTVVTEAMASGLPVIGSVYSEAVVETVVDGVNGWRFAPESAAAVAAGLMRAFATSPAELNEMRAAARRTAAGLDAGLLASKMVNILREVV
jgi:glycosyltransferase involved in cell wall biosynthesis